MQQTARPERAPSVFVSFLRSARRTSRRAQCFTVDGPRAWWLRLAGVVALAVASACGQGSEALTCDEVDEPGAFDAGRLATLVLADRGRGCVASGCHDAETQSAGLRFDTRELVYEEFSQRGPRIYALLESGEMPRRRRPWTDEDLKLFRSWYCSGAFPP
jgi:hypothetical protein